MIQLGGMGAFYNAALSHYYLMVLRYGWSDEKIAQHYEVYMHGASLLFPIGTAVAALAQDLYGPTSLGCWIATPQPRQCLTRDDIDCTSGEHAMVYAWAYQGGPLFLLLIYIAHAMYLVYQKVREVTRKAEKWTLQHASLSASQYSVDGASSVHSSHAMGSSDGGGGGGDTPSAQQQQQQHRGQRRATRHAERTREVAWQAILYVLAYLVTHMWAFVVYHIEVYATHVPGPLLVLENVSWPLQGFLNLFVFIRPQVQATRKRTPTLTYWQAVHMVLLGNDQARRVALQQHVSAQQSGAGETAHVMANSSSHVAVRSQPRGAQSESFHNLTTSNTASNHSVNDEQPPPLPPNLNRLSEGNNEENSDSVEKESTSSSKDQKEEPAGKKNNDNSNGNEMDGARSRLPETALSPSAAGQWRLDLRAAMQDVYDD